MRRGFLLLLLMGTLCLDCNLAPQPGSFSLKFAWDKPPEGIVWIWVRVEERGDPETPGPILGSAGPTEYGGDTPASLQIDGVDNGDNRYVIAEVRDGANANLPVIYYGVSDSFSIKPGENTEVDVALTLQTPESELFEASVLMLFDGQEVSTVGKESITSATIRTRSVGAISIMLANDASFSANMATLSLEQRDGISCEVEEVEGQEWNVCEVTQWNLLTGLPEMGDQLYSVFVKFIDRYGYESQVYKASVLLDSQPPQALVSSLSPAMASAGDTVLLTVTFHEPLGESEGDAVLAVAPATGKAPLFSGPQRIGDTAIYLWSAPIPEAEEEDPDVYTFSVKVADSLGNSGNVQQVVDEEGSPLELRIDGKAPSLVEPESIELNQSLFGIEPLPGAEAHELRMEFKLREANPPTVTETDGPCVADCPTVLIGHKSVGSLERRPDLDDSSQSISGFEFVYAVDAEDWGLTDKLHELVVRWTDAAGNQGEETIPATVRFDFLRPQATSCSLTPEYADASATIRYVITASELLQEAPVLQLSSEGLFPNEPGVTSEGYVYTWEQEATGVAVDSYEVAAALVDLAGNQSDGTVCLLTGHVDGTAPAVAAQQLQVLPAVLDSLGEVRLVAGGAHTIGAAFEVTEAQAIAAASPAVVLNVPGDPIDFQQTSAVDKGDGVWSFTYELQVDAELHVYAEGSWPVRVTVDDEAGNGTVVEKLAGELVRLDFTPPGAECNLVPETGPNGYPSAQKVVLQVWPMEELHPEHLPEVVESFAPGLPDQFFSYLEGTQYSFAGVVAEAQGEQSFETAVRLTDLVGNETPDGGNACANGLLSGQLDPIPPTATAGSVTTAPQVVDSDGQPLLAAGDGYSLLATFAVPQGTTLAEGYPDVVLNVPGATEPFVMNSAVPGDDGAVEFEFELALDKPIHLGLEGYWPVRVLLQDLAGNIASEETLGGKLVRVDFTPPAADCSLIPPPDEYPYAIGEKVLVQVLPMEELAPDKLPNLVEEALPPWQGEHFYSFQEGTQYRFAHTVEEGEGERDVTVRVLLEDLVGNQTDPQEDACGDGGLTASVDGTRPEVIDVTVTLPDLLADPSEVILKSGVTVDAAVQVANTPLKPVVLLGTGVMESLSDTPEAAGEDLYLWTFRRMLTGDEGHGVQSITVSGADDAGNTFSHVEAQAAALDFVNPTAQCHVNLNSAKAGDNVILTVSFSEQLLVAPALTVDPPTMSFVLNEEASQTDGNAPQYIYEYTVPEKLPKMGWTASAAAQDLAGNPAPQLALCSAGGTLDGSAVVIDSWTVDAGYEDPDAPGVWVDTGLFARGLSRVSIEFTVNELPDGEAPEVWVGQDLVDQFQLEGLTYAYEYEVFAPAEGGTELAPVTVRIIDAAGNETFETLALLTFDYDPPGRSGVPYFERCDGYALARLDLNDLWLKQSFECDYSFEPDECGVQPGSHKGPVRVSVALSENVVEEKRILYAGEQQMLLDVCSSTPNYLVALYQPLGNEPQQECTPVTASVEDQAGNRSVIDLGCLRFDFEPPATADVDTVGRVVYTRVPWGSEVTGGEKQYLVAGKAGAVEPGARILVYDGADTETAAIVGETAADDKGGFGGPAGSESAFALQSGDLTAVYLSTMDAAGNRSDDDAWAAGPQATMVKEGEWVATMGYKSPGSTFGNPHHLEVASWFAGRHTQPDAAEPSEFGGLALPGDGDSLTSRGGGSWELRVLESENPPQLLGAALVYDEARDLLLLIGGGSLTGISNTLYAWDGGVWRIPDITDPENDGEPNYAGQPYRVYDSDRERVVLFRMPADNSSNCETWEYDGASWTLRWREPPGNGNPSDGCGLAMAYDSSRRIVVGVGRMDSWTEPPTVWEWDGTTWERRVPEDPEGDGDCTVLNNFLVFDEARGHVLVNGGFDLVTQQQTADKWAWDGVSWRKLDTEDPEGDGNPSVSGGWWRAQAYDAQRERVVTLGEADEANSTSVTWEWNGVSWKKAPVVDPEGDGNPEYSSSCAMSYDSKRGRVMLFTTSGNGSATWTWDGVSWAAVRPDPDDDGNPGDCRGHSMAYDSLRGRTVVRGAAGPVEERDTWEWDGNTWTFRSDEGPEPRRAAPMVFDSDRGVAVLHAGQSRIGNGTLDDLWEWDGFAWSEVTPTDPEGDGNPPAMDNHGMAYDSMRGVTVLFGGKDIESGCGLTWEYDGASWILRAPLDDGGVSPKTRQFTNMTYDSVRQRTVLFGGFNSTDTWEWDGEEWTEIFPLDPEGDGNPPGGQHSLVFDPLRGISVLVGGYTGLGAIWEYDGTSWARVEQSDVFGSGSPGARNNMAATFDVVWGRVVYQGGDGGTQDTWEWVPGSGQRPAQTVEWTFGASGVADDAVVNRVGIWVAGGATGFGPEGELGGVDLLLWSDGYWRSFAANQTPLAEPGNLAWASSHPHFAQTQEDWLFAGEERTLGMILAPVYGNAARYAQVATDYVEVTMNYTLGNSFGWSFEGEGDTEGWTAENVTETSPANGIWPLTLEQAVPRLLSAEENLQAWDYSQLQLGMRNENADEDVAFRWRHTTPSMCDEFACQVEFTIPGDGEWHQLKVPLQGQPGWGPEVLQFALDLPAQPDGQPFEIDWIRLTE